MLYDSGRPQGIKEVNDASESLFRYRMEYADDMMRESRNVAMRERMQAMRQIAIGRVFNKRNDSSSITRGSRPSMIPTSYHHPLNLGQISITKRDLQKKQEEVYPCSC